MQPDPKSLLYLEKTLNVPRGTSERLQIYVDTVLEWQKAINLVSPQTVPDIWWRHIVDSAQLLPLLPTNAQTALDIGSGGGFPALVLAIMTDSKVRWTLVESDRRKSIFLREVVRKTCLTHVSVVTDRIEDIASKPFDVVTARALAPLSQLLAWSARFASHAVFPKGEQAATEIATLEPDRYNIEQIQSVTDNSAVILRIDSL